MRQKLHLRHVLPSVFISNYEATLYFTLSWMTIEMKGTRNLSAVDVTNVDITAEDLT